MKFHFYTIALLFSSTLIAKAASTACDDLYSQTTYALSHAKKALKATNFEHQMYYAERALTMMEKAEALIADCGCKNSGERNYQAIKNLKKAIEPNDWEAGRFYSKKALSEIRELITALDICSNTNAEESGTMPEAQSESVVDPKTMLDSGALDQYTQELQQNYEKLNVSLMQLNNSLRYNSSTHQELGEAYQQQQQLYAIKTKKLLQEALDKLEETTNE